ncbi:MAG: hypothetical protein K0U84_18500 [Actinomycetia bacterium]|nr:hypothetical protein [Actinomycetes bacterium]
MTAALVPVAVPGTDRQIMATLVDGKPMVSLAAVRHGRRWKFRHEDLQRFADSLTEAAS